MSTVNWTPKFKNSDGTEELLVLGVDQVASSDGTSLTDFIASAGESNDLTYTELIDVIEGESLTISPMVQSAIDEVQGNVDAEIANREAAISDVKNDLATHANAKNPHGTTAKDVGASEKSTTLSLTIPTSGWTGTEAPYKNTISVTGATADNNIEVIVPPTATADEITAYVSALILNGTQASGSITLNCWGTVPDIDLPVTVIVRGD